MTITLNDNAVIHSSSTCLGPLLEDSNERLKQSHIPLNSLTDPLRFSVQVILAAVLNR